MSVDAAAIADRLRPLVRPDSPAAALVSQLHDGMDDAEFGAIAVGIVRALAQREAA